MPTRVALITTDLDAIGSFDHDMAPIEASFRDVGVLTTRCCWRDPSVAWERFDLALLRSPWDYPLYAADFRRFLKALGTKTTVLNEPSLVEWNIDKSYLLKLQHLGVPVGDTRICRSLADVAVAVAQITSRRVILKPSISSGGRHTEMFSREDMNMMGLASKILREGKSVVVQPFMDRVAQEGEVNLVFFDGVFSHAVRKMPVHLSSGAASPPPEVIAESPSPRELLLAEQTLTAVRACNDLRSHAPVPLYARVDVGASPAGPVVLECELIEPQLFLRFSKTATAQFVTSTCERL